MIGQCRQIVRFTGGKNSIHLERPFQLTAFEE
jgi:hypothetical protein